MYNRYRALNTLTPHTALPVIEMRHLGEATPKKITSKFTFNNLKQMNEEQTSEWKILKQDNSYQIYKGGQSSTTGRKYVWLYMITSMLTSYPSVTEQLCQAYIQ